MNQSRVRCGAATGAVYATGRLLAGLLREIGQPQIADPLRGLQTEHGDVVRPAAALRAARYHYQPADLNPGMSQVCGAPSNRQIGISRAWRSSQSSATIPTGTASTGTCYGGFRDGSYKLQTHADYAAVRRVQRRLDAWIKAGGIRKTKKPATDTLMDWSAAAGLDPETRMFDSETGRTYCVYFHDSSVNEYAVGYLDRADDEVVELATFYGDDRQAIAIIEKDMKRRRKAA